jgi:hypothetical protein
MLSNEGFGGKHMELIQQKITRERVVELAQMVLALLESEVPCPEQRHKVLSLAQDLPDEPIVVETLKE